MSDMGWVLGLRATLRDFAKAEDGAVTVEWVVVAAAVVGLGLAVVEPIGETAEDRAIAMKKCQRVLGRQMGKENRSFEKKMNQTSKRCGRF